MTSARVAALTRAARVLADRRPRSPQPRPPGRVARRTYRWLLGVPPGCILGFLLLFAVLTPAAIITAARRAEGDPPGAGAARPLEGMDRDRTWRSPSPDALGLGVPGLRRQRHLRHLLSPSSTGRLVDIARVSNNNHHPGAPGRERSTFGDLRNPDVRDGIRARSTSSDPAPARRWSRLTAGATTNPRAGARRPHRRSPDNPRVASTARTNPRCPWTNLEAAESLDE